jgi:hypothetical protein
MLGFVEATRDKATATGEWAGLGEVQHRLLRAMPATDDVHMGKKE